MGISTDNRYDAIIIGAGLGGLSCATHLTKKGLHVLVLDKQPKVGGYAQNYLRGDYNFDVSLHLLPALKEGQGLHRLLEYLEVLDKLDVVEHDPMYSCVFPDRIYHLPGGGTEPVLDFLQTSFPSEKSGLRDYFDNIAKLVHANTELFWTGQVDFNDFYPSRYYGKTYREFLNEHVREPRLHGILGQLWQSTGLPNSRCAANWGVEVNGWHLMSGNFYLRGGGQQLSNALAQNLRTLGNVVKVASLVKRVLLENRQVQGVELESGERFYAPIVVSNASPLKTLFGMIGEEHLGGPYVDRLKRMETSCSLLTLYMGLDCPGADVGIDGHTYFVNYQDDNERTYELGLKEVYDQTDFVISNYTDSRSAVHPQGHGIIQMAEIAPGAPWIDISRDAYDEKKRRVTEVLLDKLYRHHPEVKNHLNTVELATPRTMHIVTRNPNGAVYGFAQIPSQADNSRFGALSSFKGLYFAGAWCRGGGGGYMGSLINGRVAARHILKQRGLFDSEDRVVPSYSIPPRVNRDADEECETSSCTAFEVEAQWTNGAGELTPAGWVAMVTRALDLHIDQHRSTLASIWRPGGEEPSSLNTAIGELSLRVHPGVSIRKGEQIQITLEFWPSTKGSGQLTARGELGTPESDVLEAVATVYLMR